VRVVDLSADFRLRDRATYEQWYGPHGAPELVDGAVYGLPELHRESLPGADLVANPGCYPTAALLGLAPLAREDLIADVIIDAKSGISGAGREPTATTHFVAADENLTPYKVDAHRHTPEIEQELARLGADVRVTFTPHLVPLAQGELTSCYVIASRDVDADTVRALYAEAYAGEPWVEVVDAPPGVIEVRDTNFCRISVHHDPRTGTRAGLRGDRQPLEGRGLAGGPEPEPDVRPATRRRAAVTELRSRWVELPPYVQRGPGPLPAAFAPRASPAAQALRRPRPGPAGLRRAGRHQRGALHPLRRARGAGAPDPRALEPRSPAGGGRQLRATPTPPPAGAGLDEAARMQGAAAMAAGVDPSGVAVASTGVIGVQLDGSKVVRGVSHRRAGSCRPRAGTTSPPRSGPPTRSQGRRARRGAAVRAPCACARRPRAPG
jgi:hypothetical protein